MYVICTQTRFRVKITTNSVIKNQMRLLKYVPIPNKNPMNDPPTDPIDKIVLYFKELKINGHTGQTLFRRPWMILYKNINFKPEP